MKLFFDHFKKWGIGSDVRSTGERGKSAQGAGNGK